MTTTDDLIARAQAVPRCPTCDRATCSKMLRDATPMPARVRAAFARMLADANANPPRPLRADDRAIAEKHADQGNAADTDCRAHAVNWRERCLAVESRLADQARGLTVGAAEIDRLILDAAAIGREADARARERDAMRDSLLAIATALGVAPPTPDDIESAADSWARLGALAEAAVAGRSLTVGAALADPRVQDGSHVAEYSGEHDVAEYRQTRVDAGGFRIWSRWRLADRWGPWRDNGNTALDGCDVRKPCRLAPLADADCDPNERGPL